MECHFVIKKDK